MGLPEAELNFGDVNETGGTSIQTSAEAVSPRCRVERDQLNVSADSEEAQNKYTNKNREDV